jgi:hypothetical protein
MSKLNKIKAEFNKIAEKKQSKADKALDSILIDSSIKAEDYDPSEEDSEHPDAIEVNITGGGGVGSTNENSLVTNIDLSSLK